MELHIGQAIGFDFFNDIFQIGIDKNPHLLYRQLLEKTCVSSFLFYKTGRLIIKDHPHQVRRGLSDELEHILCFMHAAYLDNHSAALLREACWADRSLNSFMKL